MNFIKLTAFICLFFLCSAQAKKADLKLWYDKPAFNVWEAALPIGNGRLAGMVYGNPQTELIKLNESSVWSGGPNRNDNAEALNALEEVRTLIFQNRISEAEQLASEKIVKRKKINGMNYEPVGDFKLDFPGHENYKNYYRELDLNRAIVSVKYVIDDVTYEREFFSSIADNLIIVRLRASKVGKLSFNASMSSLQKSVVEVDAHNRLILSGISGDKDGVKGSVKFASLVKIDHDGGRINSNGTTVSVTDANSAILYISIGTNFKNYNDISLNHFEVAHSYLNNLGKSKYTYLLKRHLQSYQKYFHRVKLDLGTTDAVKLPTDERIMNFAKANDPQMATLYFQFGRYLLIASSQPNGQPANLQGIWNDKTSPPWGSKYTININTEMNYWPAEPTNLTEMHDPLVEMVKDLAHTGQETASVMYGSRGWVAHHNTDLWRITGPVDGVYSGMWPTGGAWLSLHLWQKYIFNGDKEYLKSIYDTIKGSALFFTDFLIEEPSNKWLVVSPSSSPENAPSKYPGKSITAGATMDNQIVFELFTSVIRAAEILNIDKDFIEILKQKRSKLPPMQIGQYGQLQEWLHDLDDPNDKHRHVSHLFGLFPGNQISYFRTPELFNAAKISLMQRGDISTGWSMGWKVNLWARLLNGDHALKLLRDQIAPVRDGEGGGTYPNLFDAHPPFQIDGNFGCTSGIAEMLVQSYDGNIFILPALPKEWEAGQISGIRTPGGFEIVKLIWKDGTVSQLEIKSNLGGNCRIRSKEDLIAKNGFNLKKAVGENDNQFFQKEKINYPIISSTVKNQEAETLYTSLYDFETKPGKIYKFTVNQ